jgi:hypothetical protein
VEAATKKIIAFCAQKRVLKKLRIKSKLAKWNNHLTARKALAAPAKL